MKLDHRKAKCSIVLRDSAGTPMAGRKVHLELKKHAFLFGCGIFWLAELLDPGASPERKDLLQITGTHGKSCSTMERFRSIREHTKDERVIPMKRQCFELPNICIATTVP